MNKKVFIDPKTNIPYCSFYLKGLINLYGSRNIKFKSEPFSKLPPIGGNMRFIIQDKFKESKVFIHTNDSYDIELEQYEWCDIYGNVNANFTHYPINKFPKQVSLVPSFGIRNFTLIETIYYSISNFFKSFDEIIRWNLYNKETKKYEHNIYKNIRRYFLNYIKNFIQRVPIETYKNVSTIKKNYIFFLSTLWYSDEYNKNDEGVNRRRANFIEVCKKIENINFEGGLLEDKSSSSNLFEHSKTNVKSSLFDWILKTKESELVFNTPAFWDCHGWKLGEYLALGKAIITTPLSNDLPKPLIHGTHFHVIPDSSTESIREAVVYILENSSYRKHLESNARKYWEDYGTPEMALQLLFKRE